MNIITPNRKTKASIKDALVILNRKIAILKHEIAILNRNIAIPCFRTNNVSGSDYFYNLTKKTFSPIRWQKISSKKCLTFKAPAKVGAYHRNTILIASNEINVNKSRYFSINL